ncbi:hypothetical protein [Streptomyces incarnatus]|uniref:hypothetical protein n=1 Tax=Streptomyces incarnatus TaxID=665007 RepID=UPI000A6C08AE|nr:hypothetical protein [Streptomyces incarnatus]
MKFSRSTVVTASALGAAALAATGVTYASAASAPEAAPAAAAPQAAPAAPAPLGGAGGSNNNGNSNNNNDNNNNGKGNEGKGNEGREGRRHFEGRIEINERSYSAHPGDCITVVSGLGAKTLNIRNDSHRVVEVFRGAVCDNGAPVATVGPFSQSDGVRVRQTRGIHVHDGVVGSFRVVGHDGWGWGGRDGGHDGGWDGGWDGGDGGDGGR